jgi:hypothetical protein
MNKARVFLLFTLIISAIGGLALLNNRKVIISPTEGRTEEEFKISFSSIDSISKKDLYDLIKRKLNLILDNKKFRGIESIVKSRFYLTEAQNPLIFVDYYFDDKLTLYNSLRMYRLRYRFKSESEFYSYSETKEKSSFPIRCEVQLKTYDNIDKDYFKSQEYRFEFRSESPPFNIKNNPAPPPPWPKREFLKIAKLGKYRNYHMLPHFKLEEGISLKRSASLVTKRKRFHLNIRTPWGIGPNPEQAFIISVDHSIIPKNGDQFSEIEIEFERNVSTTFEQLSPTDTRLARISKEFKAIQKLIYEELKHELIQRNLSLVSSMTKYARTISLINKKKPL